ncbi:MAG: NAD-dependent epimerase/dehydratase family protein [Caldilinea sp. CFX5]|nr:NAD-dependent epimerase/dehydratase family protein [Caldilinea sp. CFX5]
MTEQKRLRIGLVGCGAHGRSLAVALTQSAAWQLVACADPDLMAATATATAAGPTLPFPSVEELLARVAVDAVVLATPPACLYETALAAIAAQKHVLAEKPIGLDEKEAAQLEEAVSYVHDLLFQEVPMTTLLVGATGLLGGEIARRLTNQGRHVRALVRTTADPAKIETLKKMGCALVYGDLRDRASLDAACRGVEEVVTTASTTFSRQPGDSIEVTDNAGQLALVAAAKAAHVRHFVYTSYSGQLDPGPNPCALTVAKRTVEKALKESGMTYTILRPSCFMEIWLSPAVGFDYPNAKATIYGAGEKKLSWISFYDVAEFAVESLDNPAARNAILELGGPAALSPLEVVKIFEAVTGRPFTVNFVPVETLEVQRESATDSLSEAFATLMLSYASGDVIDMQATLKEFPLALTTVKEYAAKQLVHA